MHRERIHLLVDQFSVCFTKVGQYIHNIWNYNYFSLMLCLSCDFGLIIWHQIDLFESNLKCLVSETQLLLARNRSFSSKLCSYRDVT